MLRLLSLLKERRFVSLAFLGPERQRPRGRPFLQIAEAEVMSKPRIHILALGGTIATRPDSTGAMQMGLGADDLVAAVPLLKEVAEIGAETVSRVGSHSLSFDQIHALAAKIRGLKADGIVVTQGTDTLEETSFLLDLLLDLDIPVIVTAAMRNPALTSPDGPGNLLAAVRVAADPWVRKNAKALGVIAVMLDEVYAASDVLKIHPTRLNAFASTADRSAGRAGRGSGRAVLAAGARRRRRGAQETCGRERQGRADRAVLDVARRRCRAHAADARGVRPPRLSRRRDRGDGRRPHAGTRDRESSSASPRRCRPSCRRAPAAGRCCARPMAGRARRSRCARPA